MTAALAPLETLYEMKRGKALPLPPRLARIYGRLRMPVARGRPHVIGNFVTTLDGIVSLGEKGHASGGEIRALRGGAALRARAIVRAVQGAAEDGIYLVEGGPRLLGDFLAERMLDEQFLTLAPQIAGRESGDHRLGLVMGRTFAPRSPLWGRLVDLRRGASHLFLRYAFTG